MDKIGIDVSQAKIALQGFGNVGSYKAKYLEGKDARVVAIAKKDYAIFKADGLNFGDLNRFFENEKDPVSYHGVQVISLDEFKKLDV